MQAVRFVGVGRPAQIEDVPKPSPGPGQVLIKIGGAGVCHSDLHVMEEDLGFKPPFTLGHENAGWVVRARRRRHGFQGRRCRRRLWSVGLRPLPRVSALDGELLRELGPDERLRRRTGSRRRDGRIHARAVRATAGSAGRPESGEGRAAERCRADAVSRDQAGAAAPQRGQHGCRCSASAVSGTWRFNSCACSPPSASSPPTLTTRNCSTPKRSARTTS